ncbi:hypothetical protein ACOXXX_04790 [Thalassococcus sp. BH17M4-6]|uniref:hypothetical protein n=1 Tax=Thalassococcus sp. BH17M4-6 TaxID=3413148 RepID=UPI003BC9DEA9
MQPVWICTHCIEGATVGRISNLGGHHYADCGRESHFGDLRAPGTTVLRHPDHLGPELSVIAGQLPMSCSTFLKGEAWLFESFEDSSASEIDAPLCLTPDSLLDEYPDYVASEEYYLVGAPAGDLAIQNLDGVRSVMVWDDPKLAQTALATGQFGNDSVIKLSREGLIATLNGIDLKFMNVNFELDRPSDLVLIAEFIQCFQDT